MGNNIFQVNFVIDICTWPTHDKYFNKRLSDMTIFLFDWSGLYSHVLLIVSMCNFCFHKIWEGVRGLMFILMSAKKLVVMQFEPLNLQKTWFAVPENGSSKFFRKNYIVFHNKIQWFIWKTSKFDISGATYVLLSFKIYD